MIDQKTRLLFKKWLRMSDGGCLTGGAPDCYGVYVGQCQVLNANIFREGSSDLLGLEELAALKATVDFCRLTLTVAQISTKAKLNHVKVGLKSFSSFLGWLLEYPFARTFDQINALINLSEADADDSSEANRSQKKHTIRHSSQNHFESPIVAEMLDSYQLLFNYFADRPFTPENFYKFGLEKSIYADRISAEYVDQQFQLLINLLETGSFGGIDPQGRQKTLLHIRKYSGSKTKSKLYTELYSIVFPNAEIAVEDGGNATPKANLRRVTKCLPYSSSDAFHVSGDIQMVLKNFQCSHVLDNRTKNPLLFEAVWNMAFTPKVIDPLTGHETLGRWPREFQPRFRNEERRRFVHLMKKFNAVADKYRPSILAAAEKVANSHAELTAFERQKFIADAMEQWEPIACEMECECIRAGQC